MVSSSCVEYQTAVLEWTIGGLKELFESTKGTEKSEVIKSDVFGEGRWQILFYPNSGHEGGADISLYLGAEATQEEKEKAVDEKWEREGLYNISFSIQVNKKSPPVRFKEAYDHPFSWKTASWGWAQLTSRNMVYYDLPAVQEQDTFLIVGKVTKQVSGM
ncbi:hypothetical protein BDV93DRAFT_602523 [Ceratobasidium sp. AG-I]|nr:hypothetical protein BDV93DRAFT_602523 [Ceratobasidium sp. AG-I]